MEENKSANSDDANSLPAAEPTGFFSPDSGSSESLPPQNEGDEVVQWTASEYIAHHKSAAWYAGLALIAVVASIIIWFITRDKISAAVIIVGALAFGFYGSRQPRQLDYQLDDKGLIVGQRGFRYDTFRSFSIINEGAFSSIIFMPLKRFAPPLTIYYAPEDEDRIVKLLSRYLPVAEHGPDPIDRLMTRIRF